MELLSISVSDPNSNRIATLTIPAELYLMFFTKPETKDQWLDSIGYPHDAKILPFKHK